MNLGSFLNRLGGLRAGLLIASVVCYPLVLFSDTTPEGLGILTAYVAPAMVIIFFFLLMLDALMSRVFMVDQTGELRALHRFHMYASLLVAAGLVASWWRFFRDIGAL